MRRMRTVAISYRIIGMFYIGNVDCCRQIVVLGPSRAWRRASSGETPPNRPPPKRATFRPIHPATFHPPVTVSGDSSRSPFPGTAPRLSPGPFASVARRFTVVASPAQRPRNIEQRTQKPGGHRVYGPKVWCRGDLQNQEFFKFGVIFFFQGFC